MPRMGLRDIFNCLQQLEKLLKDVSLAWGPRTEVKKYTEECLCLLKCRGGIYVTSSVVLRRHTPTGLEINPMKGDLHLSIEDWLQTKSKEILFDFFFPLGTPNLNMSLHNVLGFNFVIIQTKACLSSEMFFVLLSLTGKYLKSFSGVCSSSFELCEWKTNAVGIE